MIGEGRNGEKSSGGERAATAARRVGRPRLAVLSRSKIVEGALALIDAEGAANFSLQALARHLSVRPSSLYNHTAGKADILAAVQELVTDDIDATVFERLPWADATREWAWSYRAAFTAHPQVVTLFATAPVMGAQRTLAMYELVVAGFERGGWPRHEITSTMVAVESFVLGSALDAAAVPRQLTPGPDAPLVPRFAAAVEARDREGAKRGRTAADLAFEVGLTALLDGLERRREELADHA